MDYTIDWNTGMVLREGKEVANLRENGHVLLVQIYDLYVRGWVITIYEVDEDPAFASSSSYRDITIDGLNSDLYYIEIVRPGDFDEFWKEPYSMRMAQPGA